MCSQPRTRLGLIAAFLFAGPVLAQNAWQLDVWPMPLSSLGSPTSPTTISPSGTAAAGPTWIEIGGVDYPAIFIWKDDGSFVTHRKFYIDEASTGPSWDVVAVSDDGSIVIGHDGAGSTGQASPPQQIRAWKWTEATGFQALPDHPMGNGETSVMAMSADGSVILGKAFDEDPNYGVYDPEEYAVGFLEEKARRNVVWQNGSVGNLSPYYDSTRHTPYWQMPGFEELAWKYTFWASPGTSSVQMDGAGTIVAGQYTQYVGSSHPDWDNGSAANIRGAYVTPLGASETVDGPCEAAGASFWQAVSSTGGSRGGIETVRASLSESPTAHRILRSVQGKSAQVAHTVDPAVFGSFIHVQSISPDGQWMLIGEGGSAANYIWNSGYGLVDLNSFIENDICLGATNGFGGFGLRIVADGPVIMGRGFTFTDSVIWRLQPLQGIDTDDDGLLDTWEENGLDINNDGTIDLDLPAMGADPLRKDLFVEVDRMRNVPYSEAALDLVKAAFANAPVSNPDDDGFPTPDGITLHIDYATVDVVNRVATADWTNFQEIKDGTGGNDKGNFGTDAERADPNWEAIRCAREAVFRYCLFVDHLSNGEGGVSEASGLAEGAPCNDFMVALGTFEDQLQSSGKSLTDKLSGWVFMHELGHALGLDEGGGDDITHKPNYISVMNYAWPHMRTISGDMLDLDYSSENMQALNEGQLNEFNGLTSTKTPLVLSVHGYYDQNTFGQSSQFIWLNGGPHDWNGDGVASLDPSFNVQEDLNRWDDFSDWNGDGVVNQDDESPGDVLNGYDDWANIQLPLGVGGFFAQAVYGDPSTLMTPDVPADLTVALLDNPPANNICRADISGDGVIDGADLAALLAAWGTPNELTDLNADGITDGADLAEMLAAWGACE